MERYLFQDPGEASEQRRSENLQRYHHRSGKIQYHLCRHFLYTSLQAKPCIQSLTSWCSLSTRQSQRTKRKYCPLWNLPNPELPSANSFLLPRSSSYSLDRSHNIVSSLRC